MFLKTMGKKKINTERLIYCAEIKEQNEKLIPKALIHYIILVINEEQNHFRLKESIRSKDEQLNDFERDRLIEHGKKIKQSERLSLKLKTDV